MFGVVYEDISGIKRQGWRVVWGQGWAGSALGVHAVHGDGRLEMVRVQVQGVVRVGVPIGMKFMAEKSGCLRRSVQVEVLVVIAHINARR